MGRKLVSAKQLGLFRENLPGGGTSRMHAFPFTDAGWNENPADETFSLQITVDSEGGDAAVVSVENGSGETVMVDTAIAVSGGFTILTITAGEAFNGTAYVCAMA